MLVWEDRKQIDSYRQILDEIEKVGKPTRTLMPAHDRIPNVWTQSFKAWEYPIAYLWLRKLSEKLNRKLIVMDFGCGRSPFAEFLTRKGFKAWGIDNDRSGFISSGRKLINRYNTHVIYWIGDVCKFNSTQFDAVISCSVIEHILPSQHRIMVLRKLRSLLKPDGKMLHIIDFYFPEKKEKQGDCRINVFELSKMFGFEIEDPSICPGAPDFDFEKIRKNTNFIEMKSRQEARIAIGDNID